MRCISKDASSWEATWEGRNTLDRETPCPEAYKKSMVGNRKESKWTEGSAETRPQKALFCLSGGWTFLLYVIGIIGEFFKKQEQG